jgi:hypothetical protein
MRIPRIGIQRFMVAVVFLAIFLWAGPVVVPDAVRRWRQCYDTATRYEVEAKFYYASAAKLQAMSRLSGANQERKRGDWYTEKSGRCRRSLLMPWELYDISWREFWPAFPGLVALIVLRLVRLRRRTASAS